MINVQDIVTLLIKEICMALNFKLILPTIKDIYFHYICNSIIKGDS